MSQQIKKNIVLSIYFALAVSTLLVFWQVRNFDFVNYDDPTYVTGNLNIQTITLQSVKWAFTTGYYGNWNPLTWLSYMLDWQLFGSNPAGFHLTNLFFHIANTLLLFLVLKQMTNTIWQSAFVAALFALHPLHVEAIAWVSCRKDILSTFFWILTMWAYLQYAKQPNIWRYLLVLLFFVMGIMAKPMLVTLPFVLLLLDYWPLERKISWRLLLEKIPFIILAAVFSVIAFFTQRGLGSLTTFTKFSLKFRIYNALISYVEYIEKLFRPSHLAAFYPHPFTNVSVLYAVISAVFLLIVTIFVLRFAKNHRYLVTGWFWYLGTLVPVIGLIQVGSFAMADRYTYITLTGLFIIIAWGLSELSAKWISVSPQRKIILGVSMVIVLTTLGICAGRQTSYWKNSITLFSHARQVTQNNYLACYNLGAAYDSLGRWTEAIDAYQQAIRINPDLAEPHYNLGIAYGKIGRLPEAIDAYSKAIRINPNSVDAYLNLGNAYAKLSRRQDAIDAYRQAIKIKPDYAEAHYNLGVAYSELGRHQEAIETYKQAIIIKPDDAEAHHNLGVTYSKLGRYQEAIESFKQAIRIKPDLAEAHYNLGVAYSKLGRYQDEIESYKQAIRIKSDYADAYLALGNAYSKLGRYQDSVEACKQAIRIRPDYVEAYNNLGFAYGFLGLYQQEIDACRQAVKIQPDYAQAYNNIGVAYGSLGDYQQEIDAYKQAIKIKPDLAEAYCNLGFAYLAIGDKKSALAEYNILKSLNPELANKLLNQINK
jgi:tetratricopeptide (TPR) repeat protein